MKWIKVEVNNIVKFVDDNYNFIIDKIDSLFEKNEEILYYMLRNYITTNKHTLFEGFNRNVQSHDEIIL